MMAMTEDSNMNRGLQPSRNGDSSLKGLGCSKEQVDESIRRLGPLWDQLSQSFQERIARAKEGQQELDRPVGGENRKDN
jgi:hypothetical protein